MSFKEWQMQESHNKQQQESKLTNTYEEFYPNTSYLNNPLSNSYKNIAIQQQQHQQQIQHLQE